MGLPVALEKLFDWLESCGLRFGDCLALSSQEIFLPRDCKGEKFDKIRGVTNEVRTGGTQLTFIKDPKFFSCAFIGTAKYRTEVDERLYLLCQTGCDGSYAALWIDDKGKQQIVHIGAGSGSLPCCILAANPVGFIRLNAIGYE